MELKDLGLGKIGIGNVNIDLGEIVNNPAKFNEAIDQNAISRGRRRMDVEEGSALDKALTLNDELAVKKIETKNMFSKSAAYFDEKAFEELKGLSQFKWYVFTQVLWMIACFPCLGFGLWFTSTQNYSSEKKGIFIALWIFACVWAFVLSSVSVYMCKSGKMKTCQHGVIEKILPRADKEKKKWTIIVRGSNGEQYVVRKDIRKANELSKGYIRDWYENEYRELIGYDVILWRDSPLRQYQFVIMAGTSEQIRDKRYTRPGRR